MIYGADAIGKIIKKHPREIGELVAKAGLVAWQEGPTGKWRALCVDLLRFNQMQREEQSQKPCQ